MDLNRNSRIFVLCPNVNHAAGGVKQLYRQVDVLNKNGFSAFILHQLPGFRCTWFNNTTRIAYKSDIIKYETSTLFEKISGFLAKPFFNPFYLLVSLIKHKNIKFEPTDYLVIPEIYGPDVAKMEKGLKKVIFNQNAHYSFMGYSLRRDKMETPYLNEEVVATLVISDHSFNYLKFIFPNLNVKRFYNGLDSNVFCYSPAKKKQIAFMPRKLANQLTQVVNILKFKGSLGDFELVSIENKTEKETAQILKDSLIFLSFSTQEGCPLPPMEAMACGCIVIGYDGNGGKEYFKEEFCYPVNAEDIITFVETVESVIREYDKDKDSLLAKGKRASEFILKTYSLEKEEKGIVDLWKEIKNDNNKNST